MEGKIANDVELDCAIFQVSSTHNRYESIACSKGKTELAGSGSLDQLVLHLQEAKRFQSNSSSGTFKLQLAGNAKGSWFTKSTLARFLHIINSSEVLKSANAILHEMSQLEETRKFHLSLYSKEQQNHIGGDLAGGSLGTIGMPQQGNVDTNSSEATKNELLRALDLRLTALKEEMVVLLNRAVGSNLLTREISDLSVFVQHFGTSDSRNWLLRCLSVILNYQPSELHPQPSLISETHDKGENALEICDINPETDIQRPVTNSVSPAKLAQVERQSSIESEESSESSDEDQAVVERSRPLIRSASPRRSASPMRRVQIGRSGSRRSTAIAIKSLSFFPARERFPLDKDVDESNSCDGETDQPPRKADSTVRRMSVQDAINLFEGKQKDQNLDGQNKKAGLVGTTKSVLRRWSAGMGDSLNNKSQESTSDSTSQSTSVNMVEAEKKVAEMKVESDTPLSNLVAPDGGTFNADAYGTTLSEMERVVSSPTNISTEPSKSEQDESSDRATASAEWNRQKEAELNQMLMKMMEVRPGKFGGTNVSGAGLDDSSNEQKDGFYSQHTEKRDAKLRAEKGGRQTVKDSHSKVLKETLEQNKAVMASRTGAITEKRNSPVPQRARRNSSPVLPKKEVSKTPAPKKASPKPTPAPATRSWSGGSLTKASSSQKPKSSPGMVSTSTPTSRRTPTTPSSSQPTPKAERPVQQLKNKKETLPAAKPAIKGQEEKKTKTVTKTSRGVKAKSSPASEEKSNSTTKPSLYNKVTKKSSVVPLESKTLKKGTGMSPGVGPGAAKSKAPQFDDSSKDSGSVTQAEDKDSAPVTTESTTKVLEADLAQPANDVDENLEISLDNDLNIEKTEKPASSLTATEMGFNEPVELPTIEVQPADEDMGIPSAAWVEVEPQEEVTDMCENVVAEDVISPAIAPVPSSSPRIRHSLSQMLQADSNEPEIIEWGNAENPPALVFQKDSPKGFKRLLKFARKSKGDTNANGWASPSVFSEGEDELEESRGANSNNVDGGNSSRRAFDGHKTNSILSAQSITSSLSSMSSDKLRDRHGVATSTKASRSFFSLSNFRSSKSNESKPR